MGYVVKMPKLGMDMSTGTVTRWAVSAGDAIEAGDVLAEVESEKTVAEVEAREGGVLRKVYLDEGGETPPGGSIGIVAGADDDISELEAQAGGEAASAETEEADEAEEEPEEAATASADSGRQSAVTKRSESTSAEEVKATPRAKQKAEELGVDLTTVEATGPQGAVSADDVAAAAESGSGGGAASTADVKATPKAKKLAEELGVDLTTIEGTGPQGSVSADDVETAAESAAETAAEPSEEEPETATGSSGRVFASPSARRLAREQGVDLATVSGSGPSGRITDADVRAAAGSNGEAAESAVIATPDESIERERPLTGMRRTIADRLGKSYREAVHVTEHRGADAEEMLAAATAADEALAPKVSVTDILLLAISNALTAHPEFNATFTDDVHHLHEEQNIALAVDIDEGLVTPVVRGVESLSLADLAEKRDRMTQKALSGEYTMDDLSGGTFTVSNLGLLGVESFDPIINPPQIAILGVNTIKKEVVPVGDDDVGVRKRISVDLSFDHRIVDGADAARFLNTLVDGIENPWPLVIAAGER